MTEELGKIKPRKIPASQAIPGNAEHARLIARQNKKRSVARQGLNSRVFSKWLSLSGILIAVLLIILFGI